MNMKQDVIELDGAIGGGQVLRSGLSLSMVTGLTLRIKNIRAKRSRPGLMRQHLTSCAGGGASLWCQSARC